MTLTQAVMRCWQISSRSASVKAEALVSINVVNDSDLESAVVGYIDVEYAPVG